MQSPQATTNNPLVVIPYACDNPGYPGLKLSENVGIMPNHDIEIAQNIENGDSGRRFEPYVDASPLKWSRVSLIAAASSINDTSATPSESMVDGPLLPRYPVRRRAIPYVLDDNGHMYIRVFPIPAPCYPSLELQSDHEEILRAAVQERAAELHVEAYLDWPSITWSGEGREYWDPVNALSDTLATASLEDDTIDHGHQDTTEDRVQMMAQKIEHLSNVNRRAIYELEQPSRLCKDLACLSAQIEIAGTPAYMLFDSGSNIDSITPEFAKATNCKSIKLDEQVTLQLGCVGSRSKINYGTRAPVNFGGIRGHVYFDQANLDRYDGVIGTPFMNKHGILLDFANREIRFPNNRTIKALSTIEEASLLATRAAETHTLPHSN
ncbi:hypothetical protein B0H13DRAFT_2353392 [Mycena leptocephala]|nr:hypothetical protein B0H13DRAFT_2353392 [Mycena leptocephala]